MIQWHPAMTWAGKSEEAKHVSSKGYTLSLKILRRQKNQGAKGRSDRGGGSFLGLPLPSLCTVNVITEYHAFSFSAASHY